MGSEASVLKLHEAYFHPMKAERILLRPLRPEDAAAMFEYTSVPENFKFLNRSYHTSIAEDEEFIAKVLLGYKKRAEFIWGIELEENHKLIGTCRIFNIQTDKQSCEFSYIMNPAYQRRGLTAEAIRRLIKYVFEEWKFKTVVARCNQENINSEHVMLAAGMHLKKGDKEYWSFHGKEVACKRYELNNKAWESPSEQATHKEED